MGWEDDRPIPDFTLVRKGKVLNPLLGRQSYVRNLIASIGSGGSSG